VNETFFLCVADLVLKTKNKKKHSDLTCPLVLEVEQTGSVDLVTGDPSEIESVSERFEHPKLALGRLLSRRGHHLHKVGVRRDALPRRRPNREAILSPRQQAGHNSPQIVATPQHNRRLYESGRLGDVGHLLELDLVARDYAVRLLRLVPLELHARRAVRPAPQIEHGPGNSLRRLRAYRRRELTLVALVESRDLQRDRGVGRQIRDQRLAHIAIDLEISHKQSRDI